MATQAYYTWVNAGRPWRLAKPIAEVQTWARAAGVSVLGTIGNEDHLTADFPEDHTPFTYTAWPVPLPGYIVTAIDLANVNGLGPAIEAKARAGAYPWLKYMNHSGKNIDFRTGAVYPNADQHVHLSIRSDWIDRSIGTFDPWGDDMAFLDDRDAAILAWRAEALATDSEVVRGGATKGEPMGVVKRIHALEAKLDALAARPPVQSAPVDPAVLAAALADPAVVDVLADAVADKLAGRLAD